MKIKQFFISSVLSVVFLLVPSAMKAQSGPDETYRNDEDPPITIGTSDSRMIGTIIELEDNRVELRVSMVGEIKARIFQFAFLYQPSKVVLTDKDFGADISPAPGNITGHNVIVIPDDMKALGYEWTANRHQPVAGSVNMTALCTEISAVDNSISVPAREWKQIYTIYFKKKPGVVLTKNDFGFLGQAFLSAFSSWSNDGAFLISYVPGLNASYNYTARPQLFLFRSPSYAVVNEVTNVTPTSATIKGTYNRSHIPAAKDLVVSGLAGTDGRNTGLLKGDTILTHGFFYSNEPAEIYTNDLSNKLIIDGEEYDFPTAAEIGEGKFERGGKTFFISQRPVTPGSQSFPDELTLTGLQPGEEYFLWPYFTYSTEKTGPYASVGDRFEFETDQCIPIDFLPTVLNQSFCGTAKVSDLIAEVPEGYSVKWYASRTATTALLPTADLTDGATYYAAVVDVNECSADERVPVTVTLNVGVSSPVVTTPQAFCMPATVADLQATGVGIVWYDVPTGGTPLASNVSLTKDTYYAAQTMAGCGESARVPVKVKATTVTPVKPDIASPQSFCGDNLTLDDIAVPQNVTVVWYATATSTTPLASTTRLTEGTYYAAAKAGSCQSAERTAVEVTIGTESPNAPVIRSPQYFMEGATLANIEVPNNKIVWYASETAETPLPIGTVLVDDAVYYAAQKAGDCESEERTPVTVKVVGIQCQIPPVAPEVQPELCAGATLADLTITGMNIVWYDAATGGNLLPSNTELVDGVAYYAAQHTGTEETDCPVGNRARVVANVNTTIAPVVTTPQTICKPAMVADLKATGINVVWYDALTGGTPLASNVSLTKDTYYAVEVGVCGASVRVPVTIHTTTVAPAKPVIASPQSFCGSGLTLADIATDGSAIVWYATATSTTPLASTASLAAGTYYAAAKAGGCQSAERTAVVVTIGTAVPNAPVVASPQTFWQGATLANIAVPNNQIVWYASATAETALPVGTKLTNGGVYYAAQKAGDCESAVRVPVTINIGSGTDDCNIAPVAPTVQPELCVGTTLADLTITGMSIVWYDAATGGNELPSDTELVDGVIYYAAQFSGLCESIARTPVRANVKMPNAPNVPTAQAFCNFGEATIADLTVPEGVEIIWYDAAIDGKILNENTLLVLGETYYAAQVSAGGCESATRTAVTVGRGAAPSAPVAQARQLFCGLSDNVVYTLADLEVKGTLGVIWYPDTTATALPLSSTTRIKVGTTYYAAAVTAAGCESNNRTRTAVTVGDGIHIVQKDNHILVINNNKETNKVAGIADGFDFVYYEWFKDGELVKGVGTEGEWARGGGVYVEGDLWKATLDPNAEYIARLTEKDNSIYYTCPAEIVINNAVGSIRVYPNPLVSSQIVFVDAEMEESVLETAYIEIYSPLGSYIGRVKAQKLTPVRLPEEKGVYVLKFKSVQTEEYFKVIVK